MSALLKMAAVLTAVSGLAVLPATSAQADVVTLNLDQFITGDNIGSGNITATFADIANSNNVSLTISLAALPSQNFISDFYFNYGGNTSDITSIAKTGGTGPASGDITFFPVTNNGYSPQGNSGNYDIRLGFATSNSGGGIQRFNGGETLTFVIASTLVDLSVANFNILGAGPAQRGPYAAVAHIQGLGANGQGSKTMGANPGTIVPGPIAGAGLPALMALGGFVWARRRKAVTA
jgi:hypothetical protein